MKVREVMTENVVRIGAREPVAVAARTLTQYNIGALPVCTEEGKLCGMLTDRDIVTRCLASGRQPDTTAVQEVMTGRVLSVTAEMDTREAAELMGKEQIRRLPVTENGRLCGILSLGDLANAGDGRENAAQALRRITGNPSVRD